MSAPGRSNGGFPRACPWWLRLAAAASVAALAACGSVPPLPDWQLGARGALDRANEAWLRGDARIEAAETARLRSELARTGRADLLARAELARCAARVASLQFEPCAAFEPLRAAAGAAERAYAGYLAAQVAAGEVALLPAAQRPAAGAIAGGALPTAAALQSIADPLSRLVAVGALFQAGRATPEHVALAVDTASAQGWRRPLLAWLKVQLALAERSGNAAEAERLRRRIALVDGAR